MKKPKIFDDLEKMAPLIPVPLYWFNLAGVFCGGNELCLEVTGAKSLEVFIGKRYEEVYPKNIAEKIIKNFEMAVASKKIIKAEEVIKDLTTGKERYFMAIRSPLFGEDNEIAGIVATSIEITDKKEAERLQLETELQKTKLDEQEQFRKVVDQAIHDIRSPLASLLMIVKSCERGIPEEVRIALRDASISIGDIANQLLSKYQEEYINELAKDEPQTILVALDLLQLLSEKKHQYKELPVRFNHNFCPKCNFTFIKAEPITFKRMMSNIVNNAVEAIEGKAGVVSLRLMTEGENIKIVIQDNGKGMPQKVIDKIRNNIAVTSDKKDGHGIGFMQIRETLKSSNGKFTIDTKIGKGTKITITFPVVELPEWVAKEIKLNKGDMVVVLDDDSSIHGAWEARFKDYKNDISLRHFRLGIETIDFINKFPEKEKVFLLADFELLKQELNGLHVVERVGIKRSILVTSHYANTIVRNLAKQRGTKILPKPLASEVPIIIEGDSKINDNKMGAGTLKKVDMVLIDDNRTFIDCLALLLEDKKKTVDKYYDPRQFLDNVGQYAKDTKFLIDNDFGGRITGIEIARQLHEKGYSNIYMLSGKDFNTEEIPGYLTPILKTDTDKILSFIN